MNLNAFLALQNEYLSDAVYTFLENELSIPSIRKTRLPSEKVEFFEHYKQSLPPTYSDSKAFESIEKLYFVGAIKQSLFEKSLFGNDEKTETNIQQLEADKKYDSILVFAVSINLTDHKLPSRSMLAEITRWLNRISEKLPVIVFFRYDKYLSIASTERTKYIRTEYTGEKIGKVALLRDIYLENPHRGHLDILEGLKIDRKKITDFNQLYLQWSEVFNISTLNKKFYAELSNWYFWARMEADFYKNKINKESKDDVSEAEFTAVNLIRLVTRTLFSYFLKEKGLVPHTFFDGDSIKNLLKSFQEDENTYYKAILSNVFFASLNQELSDRRWHNHQPGSTNNPDHQSDYYRYKDLFTDQDQALTLFNQIPFLNGGLFDKLQQDWFSANSPDFPKLPNKLFFAKELKADISEFFDSKDKAKKSVPVSGLINILNRYKFTVEENTPLEQDIALDPELLGRVFENLLASYNPETQTTARNASGSFYTPREIVEYMVDESLIAYFSGIIGAEYEDLLRKLFSDTDKPVDLNEDEKQKLIHAIDQCKIIDPACGSGAFPMGILNRLVQTLRKVDPENKIWKQAMIASTPPAFREQFEQSIEGKSFDYTRKLGLIQNCIYGVDIQPIAVQISKLRCFISLIVDQKPDLSKDNFGIQTLPNLESKFIAANSLIGLPKLQNLLFDDNIKDARAQIQKWNEEFFYENKKQKKKKLISQLQEKREELISVLEKSSDTTTAKLLAEWNPFDQNASASFFDPEWMFGINTGKTVKTIKIADWDQKSFYHVTWHTHNSVRLPGYDRSDELDRDPLLLTDEEQEIVTKAIFEKAEKEQWAILAYNILPNHVHIILAAKDETELQKIVQGIKGYSAWYLNRNAPDSPPTKVEGLNTHLNNPSTLVGGEVGEMQSRTLWAKSFGKSFLDEPAKSKNAFEYVARNREKDGLPPLVPRLQSWVNARLTPTNGIRKVEENEGFDIVIGNPPYVQVPKKVFSQEQFPYSEGRDKGKQNLYKVFVEHSYNLCRTNGIACMIVQSSLMCDQSSSHTRELLLRHTNLKYVIEFPKKSKDKEGQVFDSVLQGTCIYLFTKAENIDNSFGVSIGNNSLTIKNLQFETVNQNSLLRFYPTEFCIPLIRQGEFEIINRVNEVSYPFSRITNYIKKGDLSSDNDKSFFRNIEDGYSLINGDTIQRYFYKTISLWAVENQMTSQKVNSNSQRYLIAFQNITGTTDKNRIHACIFIQSNYLFLDTTIVVGIPQEIENHMSIILGILNSSLCDWYFRKTSTNNHVNGYEIEQLPIARNYADDPYGIRLIADRILSLKQSNPDADISALEAEVDARVFRLYDLTAEEIEVVLASSPASEDQKERIRENYHRL